MGKVPANWHFDVVCTENTGTQSGHIKGHAGDPNNHRVDRLARAAALSTG
jgi:ribonuclease HI